MDWKPIAAVVAPTFACALEGPLKGLAAGVAGKVLLEREGARPDEIVEAILTAQTPELMRRLRLVEAAIVEQQRTLGFTFAALRPEARQRPSPWGQVGINLLAAAVLGMFMAGVYYVFNKELPADEPASIALISSVVGYLAANTTQVLSYYFGSTSSNNRRSDAEASALRNK